MSPVRHIGVALWTLSRNHVVQFDGLSGLGFSFGNCNAAVAVERHGALAHGYRDMPEAVGPGGDNGLGFAAIYGSSRLYAGLDPVANHFVTLGAGPFSSSPLEQHAEQTAILVARGLGVPFWTDGAGRCHIYVDFTPCVHCEPWLAARPEPWIVHYGVHLAQQLDFRRERKKHFTEVARERRLGARLSAQNQARAAAIKARRV